MGAPSRSIGTPSDGAEIAQPLRLDRSVLGISLYVGDMNNPAFQQRAPDAEPRPASIGISST